MKKDSVINLRVDKRRRETYERAAVLSGTTLSGLVTAAADARAEEILEASASMSLPSTVFDELLSALEHTSPLAPSLDKALSSPRFENR